MSREAPARHAFSGVPVAAFLNDHHDTDEFWFLDF
jgi:hypothetical protein